MHLTNNQVELNCRNQKLHYSHQNLLQLQENILKSGKDDINLNLNVEPYLLQGGNNKVFLNLIGLLTHKLTDISLQNYM